MDRSSRLIALATAALFAQLSTARADDQLADPVRPYQPKPPTATITVQPIPNTQNEMGVDVWLETAGGQPAPYEPQSVAPALAARVVPVQVAEQAPIYHPGPNPPAPAAVPPPLAAAVSPPAAHVAPQVAAADYDSFLSEPVAVFLKDATVDEILSYIIPSPWKVESDFTADIRNKRFHIAMESSRADALNALRRNMGLRITAYPKLALIVATDRKDTQ